MLGISIEIGRRHNHNKNPIAEKAIQEVEHELIRMFPDGVPLTGPQLALAIDHLNKRIRSRGFSSHDIFLQRDSFTGKQLHFDDSQLGHQQRELRIANHQLSAISQF